MSNAYLLLGRTGDVLSVLPFLKAEADAGEKPTLIVSNQHSDVLEGVNYVNAVAFDGGIHLLRDAFAWAKLRFPKVKSLQIIGSGEDVGEITYQPAGQKTAVTTSFVKEMWKVAGKMPLWDDVLPLVFDQRSPEREAALLEGCALNKKKAAVLVSVKGNSSPFPYADLLLELVRLKFNKRFQVLELPHAARIYDLLALYEQAYCLISTDSAPLHLARACPGLPVMALTNDKPRLWNGSAWQPNWTWCCRYQDFPGRATEMLKAIETCRDEAVLPITIWNAYDSQLIATRFPRTSLPIMAGSCGRDSANTIKSEKRIPYLKDCVRMGLQRAGGNDPVCLTRPDIRIHALSSYPDAGYAYRLTRNGEGETFSPIVDLFVARKPWWKAHLSEIPDLLLGSDYYWSHALWAMFKKHGAVDLTGVCYREKAA